MPGLCGFVVQGGENAEARLVSLRENLRHHPRHHLLPAFHDGKIAASLVLHQPGMAGWYGSGSNGTQVWIDGEVFNDVGTVPGEELAAELAVGAPKPWNGAFSAVVYDADAGRLRFITDPYGLKYLYLRTEGLPAWCGELRGFLRMPGPPPRLNHTCLDEILEHGYPLGGTTWFEGVELLAPGMMLTYDLESRQWTRRRYFRLEDPQPASAPSFDETVAELGGLFRKAVARRCGGEKRVGLTLSGGLDSRAILAAMPETGTPPETLTFGKPGCADETIARAASALRGAPHAFIPLGGDGWLEARTGGVLLTDGQISILDLHDLESLPALEARMDICLNGFLGDALLGGSYLEGNGSPFLVRYLHRGRRFILQALHYGGDGVIFRLPFLDVPLLTKVLALPRHWLRGSRIYRAMLLREFPEFFRTLPWEKTGLPISAPAWRETLALKMRALRRRLRIGSDGYQDYPRWLRTGSAADFLRAQLGSGALLRRTLPSDTLEYRLRRHFQGRDESAMLGRYLTAEIWLKFLQREGVG